MIIGHTKLLPQQLNILIFSFHMPLFIVLSGMTYKIPKHKNDIKENIKKYIKRLLIPYFITVLICVFIQLLKTDNSFNIYFLIKEIIKQFLWGNGCSYHFFGHDFTGVGPVWFLVTLFFSKIIFDYINLYLKSSHYKLAVFSFLLLIGIEIGKLCWLPQGLDLVLIFLFYLYAGHWYQNEFKNMKINKNICFVATFLVWTICLGFNFNIELAVRSYPYGVLCVVQSLCGTYCVFELCKFLSSIGIFNKLLSYIGRMSLIILCVHSIEFCIIDWSLLKTNIFIICIIRVVLNILVAFIFNYIKRLIVNKYKKRVN